ncbi:predicted protein [Nematostella vectensis]|uniref:Uncharacterized protein n=1 Tax=Nematostella vectensis TaxID=45351 RepID=A7RZS4_NEMVE|nr:predicted protein [Nematostella vectensis]|eukprot:XP_001635058.1 predicted protein [Nematostella vectensis]
MPPTVQENKQKRDQDHQHAARTTRFVQYKPTSLEKNYKHELLTDIDLGVNIDLIDPQMYAVDPNGLPRPGLLINTINYRRVKSIDLEQLKAEMLQSPLCTKDSPSTANELDIYVKEYNNTLAKLLNRHAPNKTRTRVTRPVVPWYNDEIDQAKRARRKAERKWRKSKLPSDLADFKKKRNHVTNAMNKERDEYYTQFVAENSSDQRKLFDAASKLLGGNTGLRFPEHANKTVLANDIGRYFVRKINTIRADIDATSLSS